MKKISFNSIELVIPDHWDDITDEMDEENAPFTLADPENGVGALQFSMASYLSGTIPDPSPEDLQQLAINFAKNYQTGSIFNPSFYKNGCLIGSAISFRAESNFIRLWYFSNQVDFVFITYVSAWEEQEKEQAVCENIVRSIYFNLYK